jgi:hypothetical protein
MTKQDRAMRFSQRSSSNSLLESSTCRAPLGQRNGGLFWTFGHFPDSPRNPWGRKAYYKQERQWTNKHNIEARSRNHSCRRRTKSITYSECVLVASVIQHAMRVLHIDVCGLSDSAIFFFTLSHIRYDFPKKEKAIQKACTDKLCVLILCKSFSETFLSPRRIERDVIKKCILAFT